MSNCKRKDGVTLVETLLSAAILVLVVASVLIIFVRTVDISKRIDKEYTATNLAKSRVERARTTEITHGFDSLADLNETDVIIDADGVSDPSGEYKRSTTVTTNYNGNARLTKIDATVVYKYRNEWKDAIAITITTVLTDID
ncbi:MAG: type II secretion system protein [Candidatus Omnitrophota bacterium]|nr:MAG: type II secretion system protein [Candidatus Omnitrophota bacterium]